MTALLAAQTDTKGLTVLRQRLLCVTGALLAAASSTSSAQIAFASGPLDVYAGPARGYPLVARLAPGVPIRIMGCLSDWSWCDITFGGNRGWAYAPGISYMYRGARVPIYAYAPPLGIPIVVFSIGAYWDRYYRGRPWYSQRNVWVHRPPSPDARPPWLPSMRPRTACKTACKTSAAPGSRGPARLGSGPRKPARP
jgi:uncharacterized protein YraI